MQSFLQDLRYALRQLRKTPGFGATVIATLALSIGITAAVFSVLYAMLIRPLPYQDTDRIVALETRSPEGYTQPAAYPEYQDWRRMSHGFSALAGYSGYGSVNFEGPTGPIALHVVKGTDNFFDVFGVNPILGRTFAPGEDEDGKNDVVVLSYETWQQLFGGRNDVIGEKVKLDGNAYTVIGVMPAGFRFPIGKVNAIYTPLHMVKQQREGRGSHWMPTVGRLRAGVSLSQAQADLSQVFDDLGRQYPDTKGRKVKLTDLETFVLGKSDSSLKLLLYAVMALLLIGCVNVAGLMLARGVKREREMALRSAVGAARARIVRQILTEALVFAVCGALGGVVLAAGLLRVIRMLLISALSRGAEVTLNVPVLLAALFVAVLVTILAALIPALRLSGTAPSMALRAGGSVGTSRGQHRLRAAFVVTQVALALALLVVSGLLTHLLGSLRNTDLGFSPDHILTAEVDLSPGRYDGRDMMADFYTPMLEKVRAIPGVEAAGIIQVLPIQNWGWNSEIHVIGTPPAPANAVTLAEDRIMTPGYYDVFKDRLVRGRLLDPTIDTRGSKPIIVVNEAFVKKFIPVGRDPIGMQIDQDDHNTIVGVVKDIRQNIYEPPLAEMDYMASQVPPGWEQAVLNNVTLVVRTSVAPESIGPSLRKVFHDVDPTLPFRTPETMQSVIADTLIFERLENWLFGTFAALAVLLAIVGLYGLISHEVELSTRDIGVRMALGASRGRILSGIYRRVGWMLGGGVVIGLILTAFARKYISSVVEMHVDKDAGRILGLTLALIGAGLVAAFFPARRASSVEPVVALRDE
ncbi:ABC transporter permease [Alloacidobacterium dinghuense]|uniref:ABC transporter permease n=1 Tax=Alloacidobacterium dinghuense TaxID=2763107 RepID=A0A7G8BE35_9BACT|nr:ABC transporter permease [Alloacidobacterium dinghuense]QNI30805.1 ABC transporter permease [Alloacidobacterium dinghuense]